MPEELPNSFWEKLITNNPATPLRDLLLSKEISSRHPEILAERNEPDLCAIVYKIDSSQKNNNERLHEIAFFDRNNDELTFSHSYNLSELANLYCKENTSAVHIRQLGDAVLHAAAIPVTDFSARHLSEINNQLNVMKPVLYVTGGVGIAANQCLAIENPAKIVLAGVDYRNPEHTVKAITRYPLALFPQLQVYINPDLVEMSEELGIFPEGCLSMQGALRALVSRPKEITIRYQDLTGKTLVKSFTGTDARVMLHEVDHINNGKVYIQRVFEELTQTQLELLLKIINEVTSTITPETSASAFVTPTIVFERDAAGHIIFDEKEITKALTAMPKKTLLALCENIKKS